MRFLGLLSNVLRHPLVGLRGAWEFRSFVGLTFHDDPHHSKSVAYDSGRELAHILTFRRWDV